MGSHLIPAGAPTKEFFAQAFHPGAGASWESHGVALHDANDKADGMFGVPSDFSSITNAEIIVRPLVTQAAANWDITTSYQAVGEAIDTHTETDTTSTYNVVVNEVFAVDISGLLPDLAANDTVFVRFNLANAGHDVVIMGLRFKYS